MTKARDLANFVSAGNPLADGTIDVADINGVTATTAEINYIDGVTSPLQTQLNAKAATADIGVTIQGYDADTAKLDVIQTFTANQTVTAEFKANSYNETYSAVTSTTNATTVNCETGNTFSHTLTESTTFTFSNPPATGTGYTMTLEIVQDAGASGYIVTWPTSVDFPAATAPTLTATASAVDVFVFTTRDGGTNWYGFTAGLGLATPA
jgi:hypothetical protein